MVRIKHRYLLFNILYPSPFPPSTSTSPAKEPPYLSFHHPTPAHITPGLLLTHLRALIATHFGDTGLGLTTSSLKIVYFSRATSTAILRCPRAHVQLVWAALTYMTALPRGRGPGEEGRECVVRVVRVSGTIKKSEEELVRRAKTEVVRAREAEERGEGDLLARLFEGGGSGKGRGGLGEDESEGKDGDDETDED